MHGHSGYFLILPCNRQIHFCICLKHSWRGKKKASGQVRKTFLHSRKHSALERREEEPGETKDIQAFRKIQRSWKGYDYVPFLEERIQLSNIWGEVAYVAGRERSKKKKKNQSFSQSIG